MPLTAAVKYIDNVSTTDSDTGIITDRRMAIDDTATDNNHKVTHEHICLCATYQSLGLPFNCYTCSLYNVIGCINKVHTEKTKLQRNLKFNRLT